MLKPKDFTFHKAIRYRSYTLEAKNFHADCERLKSKDVSIKRHSMFENQGKTLEIKNLPIDCERLKSKDETSTKLHSMSENLKPGEISKASYEIKDEGDSAICLTLKAYHVRK
uniref:Uncharacterized protein n=1 Tax=Glossina austeni TaxID=7395 RepID=A0A1A9UV78_GLOAU